MAINSFRALTPSIFLEVNNSFLDVSGPEGGFRFARGLQMHKTDGTIVWLQQVDTTFIDEYAVERSTTDVNFTGQPKYWANWDATTLIVAPTPNVAYTVEMWYDETAERLGNGCRYNFNNNIYIK